MKKTKADLILHPVRYRILQVLLDRQLNTQQIAQEMPQIPLSSIYRHLKTLLDSGLVQVMETNLVKGIEERIYTVGVLPHISGDEYQNYSKDETQRFFAAYLSFLLSGFTNFLFSREQIDYEKEKVGFTDHVFYVTPEEMDAFGAELQKLFLALQENEPEGERQRQFLSIITFPIDRKDT